MEVITQEDANQEEDVIKNLRTESSETSTAPQLEVLNDLVEKPTELVTLGEEN